MSDSPPTILRAPLAPLSRPLGGHRGGLRGRAGDASARSLHKLRRRAQQRTERAPQTVVFDAPTVVFNLPHPDRAKRFRDRKSFRRQRLDRLKPLDDLPRAKSRPHHRHPPRTAIHAASERPPSAVKSGIMRLAGYPEIGRRIKLSQQMPNLKSRDLRASRIQRSGSDSCDSPGIACRPRRCSRR